MTHVRTRKFANCLLVAAVLVSAVPFNLIAQEWPQWALNAQHSLTLTTVAAQPLDRNQANILYDFNLEAEKADPNATGDLLVHYESPLIDGDSVYMMSKDGVYSNNTFSTQKWHQNKFTWQGNHLVKAWTFDSDWFAAGSTNDFWEPVYHAALANGFLYDPGMGGTIFKVNKTTGEAVKRINPFGTAIDPNTYTASPISADAHGNLFYTVVKIASLPTQSFYARDVVDSWLVRVGPDDSIAKVSFNTLLSQAVIRGEAVPRANDRCKVQFAEAQLPWPPQPHAQAPTAACGTQRAALNAAPAVAPDGVIYLVSRAHLNNHYNYLLAVNPDLSGKWAASLRGRLHDGCGVSMPIGNPGGANANGGCKAGAAFGIDPGTNEPPPGRVLDDASSSPVIAPDGSVFYGVFTRYNFSQGHLFHFSVDGDFLGAFGFGWDLTPAIYAHGNTYSVVIKNNHYLEGSYCNVPNWCPPVRGSSELLGPEAYFITQIDPDMNIEWSYRSVNTQSCTRNFDGKVTCVRDRPNGFEWCVNAPVVDANGTVYVNSEDGNLYAIPQGGVGVTNIFQQLAIGAAYTPVSIGGDGRIYSQNDGHLFVVGR
jgi:hypothetical protein